MDCKERYETLKLDTCLDRLELIRFRETCFLEAPDLAFKAIKRCEEIDALEAADWEEAAKYDTATAYKTFLKKWPNGLYRDKARTEIGKRWEFLGSLAVKDDGKGNYSTRWSFLVVVGPPILLAMGIATILVLGLLSWALPMVGLPSGVTAAVPALAVVVFGVGVFGLGVEAGEALMAIVILVVLAVLSLLALKWLGFGGWISGFMQATGL